MLQNHHVLLTFDKVHNPLRLPRQATSEPPKVVRTPGVFNILTWKCASRHSCVHFFDISTSKSGPTMVCFVHFHFEMCFAPQTACTFSTSQVPKVVRTWCVLYILTWKCVSRPQRRALFRHLKYQKWSAPGVFCAFRLGNVLRATTACNFSSLLWPAGSAPARFSEPTFSTLRSHKSLDKHSEPRLSHLFAHLHLLSSYSFSSTLLSSNLSLLSASSQLCFSSVHIVGSLTSKLPSMIVGKE